MYPVIHTANRSPVSGTDLAFSALPDAPVMEHRARPSALRGARALLATGLHSLARVVEPSAAPAPSRHEVCA